MSGRICRRNDLELNPCHLHIEFSRLGKIGRGDWPGTQSVSFLYRIILIEKIGTQSVSFLYRISRMCRMCRGDWLGTQSVSSICITILDWWAECLLEIRPLVEVNNLELNPCHSYIVSRMSRRVTSSGFFLYTKSYVEGMTWNSIRVISI